MASELQQRARAAVGSNHLEDAVAHALAHAAHVRPHASSSPRCTADLPYTQAELEGLTGLRFRAEVRPPVPGMGSSRSAAGSSCWRESREASSG